jgi:threonine/homoserine/homoserine lactone efflux protein
VEVDQLTGTVVNPSLYEAFLAAAVILIVIPGPDMMFIVSVGARGGPAAGLLAAAGAAVGLTVHTAAAVLGLSALFTALPALYHLLRWAGASYLLYLAVKAFRARSPAAEGNGQAAGISCPSRFRAFWQAVVIDVLNPKTILFFVTFLPQFVAPDLGNVSLQFLILGITFVLADLVIDGLIGLASGRLTRALRRSRRVARGLNVISGTVLAGLAIRLIAAQR